MVCCLWPVLNLLPLTARLAKNTCPSLLLHAPCPHMRMHALPASPTLPHHPVRLPPALQAPVPGRGTQDGKEVEATGVNPGLEAAAEQAEKVEDVLR